MTYLLALLGGLLGAAIGWTNTPRPATAEDAYDIRYRVVWPE